MVRVAVEVLQGFVVGPGWHCLLYPCCCCRCVAPAVGAAAAAAEVLSTALGLHFVAAMVRVALCGSVCC